MTRNDLLHLVLAAADDTGRIFDHAEIQTWPAGSLEALRRLGLLREAVTGLHAPCPNCEDGHVESVTVRTGPGDAKRFFIWCPDAMRIEVTPEMCNAWEVDLDGLARAVATAMGLKGTPKPLVPGRLWSLGRAPWKTATREVVLALRLRDGDGPAVIPHIAVGGRTIVFVPQHPPEDRVWPGRIPAVVALSRIATLESVGLVLDVAAVGESVADADAAAEARSALPTDPEIKKQFIRQQVKAEIKTHLEDDVLVAARITYGSVRKAAKALTEQLGRTVTKDQVQNAINRAGGIKALTETMDTGSVARTVASQSRDRPKKILERR
ncbi:MAG: hypothetical protein IT469_07870 [Pseudomonadales bacterium]|nr:hypothetical protein [Pseudomonadales bacterium]